MNEALISYLLVSAFAGCVGFGVSKYAARTVPLTWATVIATIVAIGLAAAPALVLEVPGSVRLIALACIACAVFAGGYFGERTGRGDSAQRIAERRSSTRTPIQP